MASEFKFDDKTMNGLKELFGQGSAAKVEELIQHVRARENKAPDLSELGHKTPMPTRSTENFKEIQQAQKPEKN